MIPLKLVLKNFMSYGAEPVTVPFEGLHVACLSGDNGNGKSAILDAITWALWDKTRASSKDDVIRLGADDVEVRFDFMLNASRYRVVKKRKRGKVSTSDWQLTQIDSEGEHTPVGGGSQRETARQIVQLLSMEYETFLNSAYLQQGHADEFTRQTPDKRKQILGEILGLDRYTRLEEKARERQKACKEQSEELDMQIRLLDGEVASLPRYEQELEQAVARLAELVVAVKTEEETTAALREERARLNGLASQVDQAQGTVTRLQNDSRNREAERCKQLELIQGLQKTISQRASITADYEALQNSMKRRDLLEPEVEAFNKATRDLGIVQGLIDGHEKDLRGEIRLAENKIQTAERQVRERTRLEAEIHKLRGEMVDGVALEREMNAALEQLQTLQQEFAELSARNKELGVTIAEIDEVLELLVRPHATCPVCDSDLSGKKHELVVGRQREKRAATVIEQKRVKQDGAGRKQALTHMQNTVATLTEQSNAQTHRATRLVDLHASLESFAKANAELEAARKQYQDFVTRLEKGEYAMPDRLRKARLEQEIARLSQAKKEYELVRQKVGQLEGMHKRYQDLEYAENSLPQAMAESARLERMLAEIAEQLGQAVKFRDQLRAQLGQLDEVRNRAAVAESDLARMQRELNDLKVAEGSYRKYIEGCASAAAQRREKEKERAKVEDDRRLYNGLVSAFGRKGVQALIIENAIPELEEEANGLLARITDNALYVRFRTTKITKVAKEEVETLDIEVHDDVGARPYELFSGGEAFRINFAIRIALSRLLARRSGARLQTLILDEGFGSQDGKGREKLIEAIDSIKDDFEKILVITHVDELKDAFTQRIEVTKDANGSHVHLL